MTCHIVDNLRRSAEACFERGETSAQLFAQADRQDAANNPCSADCTRAIAQCVQRLEEERDAIEAAKRAVGPVFTVYFREGKSAVVVRVFGADTHWQATGLALAQKRVKNAIHVTTVEGKPESWSPGLRDFIEITA